jgi:impB/mucB/samB family
MSAFIRSISAVVRLRTVNGVRSIAKPGFLQHARNLCRREKLNSAVCHQSDNDERAHYPAGPQGAMQDHSFRHLMQVHSFVGGSRERGVVAAASYEARKFGVRSAMPSVTAKRQCPDLIFVKPRFEVYKAVSQQIREIFGEQCPVHRAALKNLLHCLISGRPYSPLADSSEDFADAVDGRYHAYSLIGAPGTCSV